MMGASDFSEKDHRLSIQIEEQAPLQASNNLLNSSTAKNNDYSDSDFGDIMIIQPEQQYRPKGLSADDYLKAIKTAVPLGSNFQAQLPEYLSHEGYFKSKGTMVQQRLANLKVSQPIHNNKSNIHLSGMASVLRKAYEKEFGKMRTDDEYSVFCRYYQGGSVQKYVYRNKQQHQEYLAEADNRKKLASRRKTNRL